jgi:hypothetical protein
MLHVDLHIPHAQEVFSRKIDFLRSLCKKIKNDPKINLFEDFFCLFAQPTKNIIFHKTIRAHIEYMKIFMRIFFTFFKHL